MSLQKQNFLFTAVCSLFFVFGASCVELDPIGHVFPIKDVDPIQIVQEKFEKLSDAEKENFLSAFQKKTEENLAKPKGIVLERAKEYHSFYYDPTVELEEDIVDLKGKVVIRKGAKVNPLEQINLYSGLLFIDGTDSKQIEWAKEQRGDYKWILTVGDPIDLSETLNRNIYFDQAGVYTKRFGIEKLPSKVTQEKNQLKIEEIPIQ